MADASLYQAQVPANWSPPPSWMIVGLALQSAKAAVKRNLQRQGIRLNTLAPKEITIRAEEYLGQNRAELTAQAWELVQRSPELRKLYDRAKWAGQRTAKV